jgi:hypothetical protein
MLAEYELGLMYEKKEGRYQNASQMEEMEIYLRR